MVMSIYDYADNIDNNKHITFYDVYKTLLNEIDCVVCKESAADLLGYSNGGFRSNIDIYTLQDYNLPYLNCHVVDDLSKIPTQDFHGIKVIPIEQTIIDLIQNSNSDEQVIFETLANYYYGNNKSYSNINPPKNLIKKFKYYGEEAKRYYETN